MSENSIAELLLTKQFKGFSAGLRKSNPFEWDILVMGPPDTIFEGGYFKAELIFPIDYPNSPPTMKFLSDMWHPNIYADGKVCISILHPPGEDEWGYEKASERWLPIHTVETILISVISMLASPNCESPANIDASVDFKDDYKTFKKKVMRTVRKKPRTIFLNE